MTQPDERGEVWLALGSDEEWESPAEFHWGQCAYCDWQGPKRNEQMGAIRDAKAHQLNCEHRGR